MIVGLTAEMLGHRVLVSTRPADSEAEATLAADQLRAMARDRKLVKPEVGILEPLKENAK